MNNNGRLIRPEDFHLAVDEVGAKERAASLALRSVKKASKLQAIKLAVSMIDLTTLEGKDLEGKVTALRRKAVHLIEAEADFPHVAAVCVYPSMITQGSIRTTMEAISYLCVVKETLGDKWLTPDLFWFGASSLLNDLLMPYRRQETGVYQSAEYFTNY